MAVDNTELWARSIAPSGKPGPDYWNYFAQRLVELAEIPEGAVILDVGTNNGNVLFKAMEKMGSRGWGVGIDIDHRGLVEGLPMLRSRPAQNTAFAQADADALCFPCETFQFVLANFVGWDYCFDFKRMQFTAQDRRMSEIMRVLRPGGRVGVGFWIEQSDIDWLVDKFMKHLPEYFESVGEDFSAYSRENSEGNRIILNNSGFNNIRIHQETTDLFLPGAENWWRQMNYAAWDYFQQIPDSSILERFKKQVFAELSQFQTNEGICFSKTVGYIFGDKP